MLSPAPAGVLPAIGVLRFHARAVKVFTTSRLEILQKDLQYRDNGRGCRDVVLRLAIFLLTRSRNSSTICIVQKLGNRKT